MIWRGASLGWALSVLILVGGGCGQWVWVALRRLEPMRMPTVCTQIVVDVVAPGGRIWNVAIAVDGAVGIRVDGLMQIYGFLPFEGIDVGIDRRSPVSWELYTRRGTFGYSGVIREVRYEPGEYSPDAEEVRIDELREIGLALE